CREKGLPIHPARFPATIPEYFIRLLTDPGDAVVDPFAGSCVTGEAAAGLLQPRSPSRAAGGIGRSSAGFLPGNLPHRTRGKAWSTGGVLPLWHGVLLFHQAALQYVCGFRPEKFLSGPFQGEDVKGPDGR